VIAKGGIWVAASYLLVCIPICSASAGGWNLVFSDEFNGDSLDRNKWATRYIYNNETLDHFHDEKQRYRDNNNQVVANGQLDLIARKGPDDLFESGMIRSFQTFYYGYFEARVFLPSGRGVWPAFWLEGDYDRDGYTHHPPEIDIFEFVINGVDDNESMLHSQAADVPAEISGDFTYVDPTFEVRHHELYANEPLNTGWHIAGMVWTPTNLSFFWDGKHIYTRNYQWLHKDGSLGDPAQILLNFAVGGGWAGRHGIDEGAFPQAFKIDYVRVCQFTTTEEGRRQCGDSTDTPDPHEYGYSAKLNDMDRPTFLSTDSPGGFHRLSHNRANPPNNADILEVGVPFKMPDKYPNDRIVSVSIIEDATSEVVALLDENIRDIPADANNIRVAKIVSPPLVHAGTYSVQSAIMIPPATGAHNSARMQHVPVNCDPGIPQPPKARTCLSLWVRVSTP
jgi:beta-glucanase (GH16 family)